MLVAFAQPHSSMYSRKFAHVIRSVCHWPAGAKAAGGEAVKREGWERSFIDLKQIWQMEVELGGADGPWSNQVVAPEPHQLARAPSFLAPRFLLLRILAEPWRGIVAHKIGQSAWFELHVGRMFGGYSNDNSYALPSTHHTKPRLPLLPTPRRMHVALLSDLLPEAFFFCAAPLIDAAPRRTLGTTIDANVYSCHGIEASVWWTSLQ
jgi:hypothetical protein